jgi:ferric-dicitrate binding protein FerR (iron transport regulator)
MDLDTLLTEAAPPVLPRSPELAQQLDELVALSEHEAAPRRHRRRALVAGALGLIGILGVGGVATASGVLPAWVPWTTEAGSQCGLHVSAELRRDGSGSLISGRSCA